MTFRISPAMIMVQTAKASRRAPTMIHPVVITDPRRITKASDMPAIQMKHEARSKMRILECWKEEIKNG